MNRTRLKPKSPILGVTLDAAALGVSRATLRRALQGKHVPQDPTLLDRYYALQRSKPLRDRGGFTLFPPSIFRVGDEAFHRAIVATWPAAVRLVTGGLQCLQAVVFTITGSAPLPALPSIPKTTPPITPTPGPESDSEPPHLPGA